MHRACASAENGRRVNHSTRGGGEEGRMKKFSVAAAALVCAAVVAACGSSDDKSPTDAGVEHGQARRLDQRLDHGSGLAEDPEGRQAVRHRLRGRPPGHQGRDPVRAVGAGARQVRDRDGRRQGPGRGRDGHDVDAGVRRPGRAHRAAEDRQGRLRVLAGGRGDARRQGLRQAVVRGRALADLPQGHPGEGGREAADELGRDDGRREGDQGEGPGRLPGLLHRA